MAQRDQAPEELMRGRLKRLGEGIGKIVYASDHWVVKRERTPSEVAALIVLWKLLRKLERIIPLGIGSGLLEKPSRRLRLLRVAVQAAMAVAPKTVWYTAHVREVWTRYQKSRIRGERLAGEILGGTALVPQTITFPPVTVKIAGWPGWLRVAEASERVESTLYQRLVELGEDGRYDDLEKWLDRFLDVRQSGWRRGLFATDAHLKNFGVIGDRIVLLDPGGVTNRWSEVESRLAFEEVVAQPHIQLGLGSVIGGRPDITERFDKRWKATVNREVVSQHWEGRFC